MKFESKIAKKFLAGILSVALVATIGMPMAFGDEDAETALDAINDAASDTSANEPDSAELPWVNPVDYTDAAPFLDPVEGEKKAASTFALRSSVSALAEEDDNGLELKKSV